MVARGEPMEGALKVLKLATQIAIAWTLLSLLLTALWALMLEFGRRFGGRPAPRPPALEERQLSAEVRAIYADFGDDDGACDGELADHERDEIAGSDAIVLIVGAASARKR
jgi:hypothetical protein